MSEIAVTLIKVLFLAMLWIFILSVASVIRSDMFGRAVPAGDLPQPELAEAPKSGKRLRRRDRGHPQRFGITNGVQAGTTADLADGTVLIGRSADCQLILEDDYVSTRHARVVAGDSGFYVEDLGSTNGTYVNGQRITQPTTIGLADTVRIGRTIMRLEV
ncbi:FHA domain-containing protein FhaB/FipA [Propionibacteriaceae bacterium Y2011]|uniref:FHA domain-containing protein FhaB/FipA n=1 Tax=Microlunatus sp. Y2014 TaxID=3418488 RepID=UPI003B457E9D